MSILGDGVRAGLFQFLVVFYGCAPADAPSEGHLEIQIDTDAPLPSVTQGPPAVFDAVAVDWSRAAAIPRAPRARGSWG